MIHLQWVKIEHKEKNKAEGNKDRTWGSNNKERYWREWMEYND